MRALVGDVGGTNCRLGIATLSDGLYTVDHIARFRVCDYDALTDVICDYRQSRDIPDRAAFAVAGPKFDDRIEMTNASWIISESELRDIGGFEDALVINDFHGMAKGASVVAQDGFDPILSGALDWTQPVTVYGPGTGMGIGLVTPSGVIPTEGGHLAFSPQNDVEDAILAYWRARKGFVSFENLVSGPGLVRTYQAVCDAAGEEPHVHASDAVVRLAADGNALAETAIRTFWDMLATYAANAATLQGASGGVVLVGGVTRHVKPWLDRDRFTARFRTRGEGSWYVEHVPVHHLHAHNVALYGAAALIL